MNERLMLLTAFICSIAGIFVIYISSGGIEGTMQPADSISLEDEGRNIKVQGKIVDYYEGDNIVIMEIEKPSVVKVVLFKNKARNLSIAEGTQLEIMGKVEEYEGSLEVIGNRVRVIG